VIVLRVFFIIHDMLYWDTVTKNLRDSLIILMQAESLSEFRLVGGTALSLHYGHRMSEDIDLFTDATYGSVDFDNIERFLQDNFNYLNGKLGGNPGMGKSYIIGKDAYNVVKLDLYYTTDPFFDKVVEREQVRMASIEDIIAMKVDVVQRGGRKKDFWDLHEAFTSYSVEQMIAFHKKRYEWTHDEAVIRRNFTDFGRADKDFDPMCLKSKHWGFIKEDIKETLINS